MTIFEDHFELRIIRSFFFSSRSFESSLGVVFPEIQNFIKKLNAKNAKNCSYNSDNTNIKIKQFKRLKPKIMKVFEFTRKVNGKSQNSRNLFPINIRILRILKYKLSELI